MSSTNTTDLLPQVALTGFSSSASYDAHRPSYHPSAVNYLLSSLGLLDRTHARVMDMAAGTGKFTEILAGRPEEFEVVAVEPHGEMRRVLEGKGLSGVTVLEGGVQNVLEGKEGRWLLGWADAVVVAQAFHWFSTPSALRALSRLLSPRGTLGIIWNVEDYNQSSNYPCTTPWESRLRDIIIQIDDGCPRYRNGVWRDVWRTEEARGLFSAGEEEDKGEGNEEGRDKEGGKKRIFEEKVFPVTVSLGKEELWKRIGTLSYVKGLENSKVAGGTGLLEELRKNFDSILDTDESVVRNEKGEIEMHYIVHVVWTRKV